MFYSRGRSYRRGGGIKTACYEVTLRSHCHTSKAVSGQGGDSRGNEYAEISHRARQQPKAVFHRHPGFEKRKEQKKKKMEKKESRGKIERAFGRCFAVKVGGSGNLETGVLRGRGIGDNSENDRGH